MSPPLETAGKLTDYRDFSKQSCFQTHWVEFLWGKCNVHITRLATVYLIFLIYTETPRYLLTRPHSITDVTTDRIQNALYLSRPRGYIQNETFTWSSNLARRDTQQTAWVLVLKVGGWLTHPCFHTRNGIAGRQRHKGRKVRDRDIGRQQRRPSAKDKRQKTDGQKTGPDRPYRRQSSCQTSPSGIELG